MIRNLRFFENLHVSLWLFKDLCWVLDWKTFGVLMIVPTVSVAIWIAWKSRNDIADLFHNLAVCFWIGANSVWMIGEFFLEDSTRPIATVFFAIGILIVAVYYLFILPRRSSENSAKV